MEILGVQTSRILEVPEMACQTNQAQVVLPSTPVLRFAHSVGAPRGTPQQIKKNALSTATNTEIRTAAEVSSDLFEPETQPSTEQTGESHVCPAEYRLKIVQKQLISNVLDIKLKVH